MVLKSLKIVREKQPELPPFEFRAPENVAAGRLLGRIRVGRNPPSPIHTEKERLRVAQQTGLGCALLGNSKASASLLSKSRERLLA
jgi:hypothetical protein